MLTKGPKGTKDILPEESYKWHYIEEEIIKICKNFGYKEIRTPVFEHTELFERGVGDTTDVVQKEMYTFLDKGGRSITLRPEGTASAARSYIENSLYGQPSPIKMYYMISCYRYEKPQHGRLREFNQFGVEVFGADNPSIDAEVISMAVEVFNSLFIKNLELNINSIGCPNCRKEYNNILKEYLSKQLGILCNTCNERYEKNPLRIFDCKAPECKVVMKQAPKLIDNICNECREHFDMVRNYLNAMEIKYNINPEIVRGLDYYTKTVFEIVSKDIGTQGTVCGGGRYDGLIEELGGPKTSGIGFAMGLERLLLIMEAQNINIPKPENIKIFIANLGEKALERSLSYINKLRKAGISAESDHMGRSLKAQMKYSNKLGAKYTVVLGDNEMEQNIAQLKNMETGETKNINLNDIIEELKKA